MPGDAKPRPRKRPSSGAGNVERLPMTPLRTLGGDPRQPRASAPVDTPASEAMRARAREVLAAEFDRVLELKQRLVAEKATADPGAPKPADDKLRGLVASLEGMSRLAIRLELITPAESRELYASAMKRGLYEGWRK